MIMKNRSNREVLTGPGRRHRNKYKKVSNTKTKKCLDRLCLCILNNA